MRGPLLAAVAAATLLSGAALALPSRVTEITVRSSRVRVGDLVSGLPDDAARSDLGPAPSYTGTRVIARDEVARALRDHGVRPEPALPDAYRVHRQLRVLAASDTTRLVSDAMADKLPRGVTLGVVRAPSTVKVPDGWTQVRGEVPRPPHRVGHVDSTVTLAFFDGEQSLWVLSVPVELIVTQEATAFDVPRGSRVTFVIRRGLVEVRSPGTVTVDADVGSVAPVTVSPSGRSFPARLEDSTTAVMVDAP